MAHIISGIIVANRLRMWFDPDKMFIGQFSACFFGKARFRAGDREFRQEEGTGTKK